MDLLARLEHLPPSRVHYKLLILVGIAWMFDAMDTGLIGFVMTSLSKDWALSPASLGYIVSIGFVGMAIGAMSAGYLADKFGRKKVLVAMMALYSVATGLCALAWNMPSLLVLRFCVGLGLGGQLPVAVTLVSEFVPARVRGRFIVLLESFWAIGWLVAALAAHLFIASMGWKVGFIIGALPIFYLPIFMKYLPESVPYLIAQNRVEEAHHTVKQWEARCKVQSSNEIILPDERKKEILSPRLLWQAPFARRTLMLWLIWFGIVYSYYGVFTWLPTLMNRAGYDIVTTFEYILLMTFAQFPGYFSAAYLVEKIGRKITLAGYIAACAVCAYFFGNASSVGAILLWGSLLSFFNLGAWGVLYSYTPELYPARFRALGSGWAAGIGRIGGIVAPLVVPLLIVGDSGTSTVFGMFASVLIAVALIILILGEETKGRTLQEINQVE